MKILKHSSFNFDNSENVAYDSPLFPAYIRKGFFSACLEYSGLIHWHEDLEFIVVLSGSMICNIDGKDIELNKENSIFLNSRHIHYLLKKENEDCEFICILLHPELLSANAEFEKNFVEPLIRNQNIPFVTLSHSVSWQEKILSLLKEISKNQFSPMVETIIQRNFFYIFELLFENCSKDEESKNRSSEKELDSLKNMILFIQEHYSEKISIDDIANSIFCSKSKCIKIFKKYLKEPPITYLIKYRLNKSSALLKSTNKSITEIALECGFNGSSYYSEAFNKYYGTSPLKWRKSNT